LALRANEEKKPIGLKNEEKCLVDEPSKGSDWLEKMKNHGRIG